MAQIPVLGSGPIDISVGGKQYSFPLSAFYFDNKGSIQINSSFLPVPAVPNLQDTLSLWLSYLVNQALLSPGQTPTPQPVFSIQAKDPGSTGNFITVKIENVALQSPVENTTLDVTVTETDTYNGLTIATLTQVIGSTTGGGSRPGLVFIPKLDTSKAKLPAAPAKATKSGGGGTPYQFTFGTGVSSIVLQAKHDDDNGQFTDANITQSDGTNFTLVVTWSTKASVTLKNLAGGSTAFAYELVVTPPSGVFTLAPAAGTITLAGGIDAQPAANAKATVPSAP